MPLLLLSFTPLLSLLLQGLKARGNVEEWLSKVEDSMFSNLRRLTKAAITDFERKEREEWVLCHVSQVILTVSQMMWCRDVNEILEGDYDRAEGMKEFRTDKLWRK